MSADQSLIDANGKVTRWPKKQIDRQMVLKYLSLKFDTNRDYTEVEVNEIIKQWHTYTDWSSLRRDLIGFGYATRDPSGLHYKFYGGNFHSSDK
jgi:hypothetical protein